MKNLPTAFQRSALWTAITALSITIIGALAIGFIYLGTKVIAFLQPILIPFAVAGVLAYLLEPGVVWLVRRGLTRQRAVLLVFAVFTLALGGIGWWVLPKIGEQTANMAKKIPGYAVKARNGAVSLARRLEEAGISLPLPHASKADATATPGAANPPAAPASAPVPVVPPTPAQSPAPSAAPSNGQITPQPASAPGTPVASPPDSSETAPKGVTREESTATPPTSTTATTGVDHEWQEFLSGEWVKTALPSILRSTWTFFKTSVGGFLGIFGFLLSFIIVPLYLFYFLLESAKIKTDWSNYIPLRSSAFKDELVACLTEINSYLVAFFRGQLFVSVINGIATALGLVVIGLDFGLLIGLALCIMGIIPYLGIALCWIPAVIIGAVQDGSALIPGTPWWAMPLAVTAVFVIVQQIDGFFITPRIVGEAVGLHPMTVIASVLIWSLLLGGLLGAILAVPLTASVKVLFQRYIWRARIAPRTALAAPPV